MNDIESRLAEAIRARANDVEPEDEDAALDHISQRVNVSRRQGLMLLSAAAAIVVVVGALVLLNRGDDKKQQVNVATDSGNNTTTTTTTDNTTPASVIPQQATAIWPFASSGQTFTTPQDAAKSFAVDYLGMRNARVGKVEAGFEYETNVEIFPNDRGTARTVVRVTNYQRDGYVVLGVMADEIQVDQPRVQDNVLTSPLTISGKSVAFEATVGIQLRPFGSTTPVFSDHTNGGSTDIQPFSTTITPPSTDQPLVLIVFEGDASGAGDMTKATVIPLNAAGSPQPTSFFAVTSSGDRVVLDFQGHVQRTLTAADEEFPTAGATLPSNVSGTLATLRGRFGTVAFFDGTNIASFNPTTNAQVKLVTPAAAPITLDADESGRYLIWVDVNHDLWTWSGGDPVKAGTGFNSAAW